MELKKFFVLYDSRKNAKMMGNLGIETYGLDKKTRRYCDSLGSNMQFSCLDEWKILGNGQKMFYN